MSSLDLTSFASIDDLPEDVGFSTFFYHLYRKKKHSDVTIILKSPSDQVELKVHKLVLSIMSPYFADLCFGPESNGRDSITVETNNPQAVEAILGSMYGFFPALKTTQEACALHKEADKLQVNSVMKCCRDYLRDINVEPLNVFGLLEVAKSMHDNGLADKCFKLLQDRTVEVIASYELLEVTKYMVHTFLKLPRLAFECEYEFLRWLLSWATAKSQEENSDCTSPREYLQKLLPEMNFLALNNNEFSRLCDENKDFFCTDEIARIFMNINLSGSMEMPDWYDKDFRLRLYTGSTN